jgi:hypothetical protein
LSLDVFITSKSLWRNSKKITETGWFIPRKTSYGVFRFISGGFHIIKQKWESTISTYYKLRETLKKYRQIEEKWGLGSDWNGSCKRIQTEWLAQNHYQIRKRLCITEI